jgi:hypothetical protein
MEIGAADRAAGDLLMITSRASSIFGSGTVSQRMSFLPFLQRAFIDASFGKRVSWPHEAWYGSRLLDHWRQWSVHRYVRYRFTPLVVDADAQSLIRQIGHRIEHLAGDAAGERRQIGPIDPNLRAGRFKRGWVGKL